MITGLKTLRSIFYLSTQIFFILSVSAFYGYSAQDKIEVSAQESESDERKVIYVKKVNSSIKIDGILDDPGWEESIPSSGFIQQEPYDKSPASQRTVVRVIMDDDNFYFGITCYDNQPNKIISNEMRRDASLLNNDNIEIFLDTFNDKKNCYYFRTNPSGARYDAMISEEGKNVNYDWNTIWRCSAKKSDPGWTAEIAIPFYAIRFKEDLNSWGVNFGREIKRENERTFWSHIPRGLGRNGKYRVSLYGKMVGLEGLSKGKNVEIIPSANGGKTTEYAPNKSSSDFDGGVDILYRITGNLRADFSYNTDFAQVEADQEVVNVSRFNLFFPEKRDFFLENAGLFQFGDVVLSERASGGGEGRRCFFIKFKSSEWIFIVLQQKNRIKRGGKDSTLWRDEVRR